jgi:glycosyltransferase involved in cell wall biosynthesis
MLRGQDIVCFSNDWDGDPLSKKHLMVRLARENRVLWVNSIGCRNPRASTRDLKRIAKKLGDFARGVRRVAPNLWVYGPLALPFHGDPRARWINERWLKASLRFACGLLRFRNPIVWSFVPSTADAAIGLRRRLLVYHCVDEFSEFTGTDARAIAEMESKLLSKADLVFVSAGSLLETKRRQNPHTFLVTHGVDVAHFRKALDPKTPIPADLPRDERPLVGFFGLVEDWVDLELVREIAAARPHWSIALIGEVATDTAPLRGLENVKLLGRRGYDQLPGYCRGFDVAILPFRINKLTVAANPLKLREYLAAGLPVVATAIPEAQRLSPPIRVAAESRDFLAHLDAVIESGQTGPRPEISRTMDEETWDRKVEEVEAAVGRFLERARFLRPNEFPPPARAGARRSAA